MFKLFIWTIRTITVSTALIFIVSVNHFSLFSISRYHTISLLKQTCFGPPMSFSVLFYMRPVKHSHFHLPTTYIHKHPAGTVLSPWKFHINSRTLGNNATIH